MVVVGCVGQSVIRGDGDANEVRRCGVERGIYTIINRQGN